MIMHIRGFAEFRKMCKQTQKLYVVSKHLNVLREYVYTLHDNFCVNNICGQIF